MRADAPRWVSAALVTICVIALAACASGPNDFDWQTSTPEREGMSGAALEALGRTLASRETRALLVIRHDRIVHEWYADDHGVDKAHYTASMAKALVGGVATAVAVTDGRIRLDDTVASYVPQWKTDPRKSRITVRHLGSHTAGLEDATAGTLPLRALHDWKGDFWKLLPPPGDPFTIARDRSPVLFDPGAQFAYSTPGSTMLGYAVTAALRDADPDDLRSLLRERVMRPIGVRDAHWSVGYRKTFVVDGLPLVAPGGGGSYTARAAARVGRLMLRRGDWQGARLIDPDAVAQVTRDAGTPGLAGIGWWSNSSEAFADLPPDAFWASGAGDQVLLVVPSLDLITVRNGRGQIGDAEDPHVRLNESLFQPLLAAVVRDGGAQARRAPYPRSDVIARLEWSAPETIVRRAKGSDTWPLTWGDDGDLYTAWADGTGFDPTMREKLSLGFARIHGGPENFTGTNVRAPTLEQKGDGPSGKKASGVLMVDGVLYLWVRNAGNAQLAWSTDRGRRWTWSDWRFTESFGAPTFLNFGPNYHGARDAYVYVYSHDSDSAYRAADRMVLARVPKDRITEREAWEFLRGVDEGNEPVWTRSISERGAVFVHPGKCFRSGISYAPALGRYLWSQTVPAGDGRDARFAGGLAIYDAPEPWGPWTTAFFAASWDVGPGETSSIPTKWMSADGDTLHLVFSGDDHFAVRKATVVQGAR